MKILYLDLNADDLVEDYSRFPNKYGGGRVVAANLMPYLNTHGHHMEIWANSKCFENVEEKFKQYCIPKTFEERIRIRYISGYDIVLHNFPSIKINCDGLDFVWLVGVGETVHPENSRIILYNQFQRPIVYNRETEAYNARIGVPIPKFKEYQKEDFVFSCHRQAKEFGSELMMQLAHEHKFRYITAGPMDQNCPGLEKYIDNKYVTYLGVIDEATKIDYFKRAKCSTYLHSWQTPFNLSACTSLSYGTPCIANSIGFWPSFIEPKKNGFLQFNDQDILWNIECCSEITQESCYNTVLKYSTEEMIKDYLKIFRI